MATRKASKKAAKRQKAYSDDDRATTLAALDANAGNVSRTARQLSIPASTITEWRDGRVHPEVTTSREVKKKELAEKLEEVAHALTGNLMTRAESELSILVPMKDVATSLGIVVDKMQLLKGKPTAINEHQDRRAEYEALVERILKRAKERGEKTTRGEVITLIVERKPEAKEYLM
jgi:transposase-like protein